MFRDHLHVIDTWIVGHKPLFSRLFIDIDVEDLVLHLHNHLLAKKRFTFINGKRHQLGQRWSEDMLHLDHQYPVRLRLFIGVGRGVEHCGRADLAAVICRGRTDGV